MRARHKDTGAVADVLDNDFYRNAGWVKVDDSTPTTEQAKRSAVNEARRGTLVDRPAAEVVAAMDSLPDEEKAAVVAEEKAGKARKTVVKAGE
jgi:hypothetical protein